MIKASLIIRVVKHLNKIENKNICLKIYIFNRFKNGEKFNINQKEITILLKNQTPPPPPIYSTLKRYLEQVVFKKRFQTVI